MRLYTLAISLFLLLNCFEIKAQKCPDGYEKVREVVVSCKPIGQFTGQGIPGGGGGVEGLFKIYDYILANLGDDQFNALLNNAPADLKTDFEFYNTFRNDGNSISENFEIKEFHTPVNQFQNMDLSQYSDILKNMSTTLGEVENKDKLLKKNNQLIKQIEKTQIQEFK